MSLRFRSLSFAGLALVAALLASSARAGDAPAAPPAPPPKIPAIESAFLGDFVGSWNIEAKTMGGGGKGVQRVRRAIGGSALLIEAHISVGGRELYATSVIRVDADRKTAKFWRIDDLSNPSLTLHEGALSDTAI